LIDVSPLRLDRDYRLLWSGGVVSIAGTQITRIALPFHVYVLTGSTAALGLLAFVQLLPILLFSLGAGSVADVVDRRRILLVTQVGHAATSLGLVAFALSPDVPLAALFALAFLDTTFGAVESPARSSALPRLVPPERLPSAIALNQLSYQVGSVVGPAFGGLLIAALGLGAAYAVDALTFAASIGAAWAIRPLPPLGDAMRPGLAAIRESLRFAASRRIILSTFVIDLNAMIFGMPTVLFAALALDVFRVGPAGVGFLAAAPAAGAFLGAALSGWVGTVQRTGRAVAIAVVAWGLAIAGFGLATFSFGLALLLLAVAGAADVLSAVFRSTIVQLETPDELRGRVSALHMLVVTSGPRIGDIEAAAVASLVGSQASVVSGGLLCLLGVVAVVRWFPELLHHRRADTGAVAPP
jgi:MFS family permease